METPFSGNRMCLTEFGERKKGKKKNVGPLSIFHDNMNGTCEFIFQPQLFPANEGRASLF